MIENILSKLAQVKQTGPQKWQAICPGHNDQKPSLSITQEPGGKILLYCFGECGNDIKRILKPVGLTAADLFPENELRKSICEKVTDTPTRKVERGGKQRQAKKEYPTVDDIAQAISQQVKGTFAGRWTYHHAGGQEAFYILRFDDPQGGKTFRPVYHNGAGFIQGDPPGKLPLYGLPSLDGAGRVYLVEGEKCCEAGRSIGLMTTTSAHGSQAASKSDWGPLAGREVITLPDNDPAGQLYAQAAARILLSLTPPAAVKIANLPGLADGQDIYDFIEGRDAVEPETLRETIEELADKAAFISEPPGGQELAAAFNLTDAGNGERFARQHGDKLRFCVNWGKWLVYDGSRWDKERGATEARRLAVITARTIRDEADQFDNLPDKKRIFDFALKSESRGGLDNMLNEARFCKPLTAYPREFDSDPMALNVLNGTIDLRTGELRPHRPGDMITKLCPVRYDPAAELQLWDEFITHATEGDKELLIFLQTAAGYSLTGDTGEEKLFFVHGPKQAGKSTFLEALKGVLGDYAITADFDTFMQRHGGGIRNDIARLESARLVSSIEMEKGKKMAEGLVKMLTGGDTVAARYLYQESFEFKPQFKLWLAANDAPRVRDDDQAMWRRILRIPFEAVIPPEKRDPKVKKTLTTQSRAKAAILAWAVRGCLVWQNNGLIVPDCVQIATNTYREDMDPLRDFFRDCCDFHEQAIVPVSELRKRYDFWASDNGIKYTIGPREFNDRVRDKGGEIETKWFYGKTQRCWRGIGLQSVENE